jgi:ribonuclease HI
MYIANSDGSTQHQTGQSGISYIIRSPRGKVLYRLSKPLYEGDSMLTEYESIIELIEKAIQLKIPTLLIKTDCKYISENLNGRNLQMISNKHLDHFARAADLIGKHQGIRIEWIPREKNKFADKLCKRARKTGDMEEMSIVNLESQIQRKCIQRIVKRNRYLMIQCKSCNERKSVDHFPPKKINGARRDCFNCISKFNVIHK